MTLIRCFVAVDLPVSLREEVRRLQERIAMDGLRPVKPEQVHVTLKFLGEQPATKVEKIKGALAGVRYRPFSARVRGMGAFPGRSIRVVWLGLEGEFQGLYELVEDSLCSLAFEREPRGFQPHVTIGRVARPSPRMSQELASRIAALSGTDLGCFSIDRFFLKKSTLTPKGPIYDDLQAFPL